MNLGIESETLEFKKTTSEINKAMDNIASMLNKHGHGVVYFGVAPDGTVAGQQVSASTLDDVARTIKDAIKPMIYPEVNRELLDGKSVIRVDFTGSEKPYSSFGRYYKRVFDRTEELTPDELKRMMAETDRSSYWENNLTDCGLEALDMSAVEDFYKQAVSCGRMDEMPQFSAEELLVGLGLYERGKLTNAGYYLFSDKKPVVLKLAVFVTDEKISFSDIVRCEDNIFNLIRKGFSYIKEHINWRVDSDGGTARIEIPEIPVEAIREIVVNSFAHANYRGISENEITITPSQIEIYNPGEFPSGLSPEMFARQRIKSMPRNKVILNTLYKSKDVELFGSGFRKVYAYCDKYGIKTGFLSEIGGFSFIFYRGSKSENAAKNGVRSAAQNGVHLAERSSRLKSPTDAIILSLLKDDPSQTRDALAQKTGKAVRTIQRALDSLSNDGMIRRIGSKRAGYWEILHDCG
ncbi:MAG: putative DNA binding domain-containing protein [Pyramidobacter sp.]|nr:putative DNA binding domain-containing protein [Pyramidobacter sp.]